MKDHFVSCVKWFKNQLTSKEQRHTGVRNTRESKVWDGKSTEHRREKKMQGSVLRFRVMYGVGRKNYYWKKSSGK